MLSAKPIVVRLVIIGFLILVGYCLAQAVYYQNTLAVILALVSLGAGIYFIHLFTQARKQLEAEENRE